MNNYYVYLHIKATDGEPFYVGKGKGSRANQASNRSEFWKRVTLKYGFDVILLEEKLTEKEAFEKEKYWIKRIGRRDLGLGTLINFTDGGEGVSGGSWKLTESNKKNIGNASKGRKWSESSKKKLSNSTKGRQGFWKGKKRGVQTEEWKQKISSSLKGITKNNKIIINLETGIFHNSLTEASFSYGIPISTLSRKIRTNKTNLKFV
jgi:hypothetical protein